MNRCKLIKPVPVMGQVLPAGMMIDAPDAFQNRLVASGRAVWVEDVQAQQKGSSGKSPAPISVENKRKPVRRKVR